MARKTLPYQRVAQKVNYAFDIAIKRVIDLASAIIGGLFIIPILLAIALAIRLDSPGPIIYRSKRVGRGGKEFDCFKFRSMYQGADERLNALLDSNPHLKEEFLTTYKLKEDPRITRVGAFLRKSSLDELPQLINVINGTMSLVGPRPMSSSELKQCGDLYEYYRIALPGMTGYWQVSGRNDVSLDERIAMEKYYIINRSLSLDIAILLKTTQVIISGKGAY